jgi:hypothetical protein
MVNSGAVKVKRNYPRLNEGRVSLTFRREPGVSNPKGAVITGFMG